jgi:hypothetical protein
MAKLQSGTTIYGNAVVNTFLTVGSYLSVAGNIYAANLIVDHSATGNIVATGNISGNYFLGNGSQLTGISAQSIANGTSNITISTAGGNIEFAIGNVANTMVLEPGSLTMYGSFATPKYIESNVAVAPNVNSIIYGPVSVSGNAIMTVPTSSTLYVYGSV